jgi:hypothetical protein
VRRTFLTRDPGVGNTLDFNMLRMEPQRSKRRQSLTMSAMKCPYPGMLIAEPTGAVKKPHLKAHQKISIPKNPLEKINFRKLKVAERQDAFRFPGQTTLEKVAVSELVARDYLKRMEALKAFAKAKKVSLSNKKKFDEVCCWFLNNLFELGFDLQDGSKTLAAIVDSHPEFSSKSQLPRTRRALQGWGKLEPQRTRPPLPWGLVCAMVIQMLNMQESIAAAATLLMFSAYLRPGECLDLQISDLVKPVPGMPHFALHLHPAERREQSKVGLSDESLLLDSPLMPWLGAVLLQLPRTNMDMFDITTTTWQTLGRKPW